MQRIISIHTRSLLPQSVTAMLLSAVGAEIECCKWIYYAMLCNAMPNQQGARSGSFPRPAQKQIGRVWIAHAGPVDTSNAKTQRTQRTNVSRQSKRHMNRLDVATERRQLAKLSQALLLWLQPRACSTKLTKNFFHSLRSAPSSRATYSSIMASGKPMSRISVPFKKR